MKLVMKNKLSSIIFLIYSIEMILILKDKKTTVTIVERRWRTILISRLFCETGCYCYALCYFSTSTDSHLKIVYNNNAARLD